MLIHIWHVIKGIVYLVREYVRIGHSVSVNPISHNFCYYNLRYWTL